MQTVLLGYSPCPNDTFVFYGMTHGRVDTEGYRFSPVLEDVETLNQWALEGRLPLTKASYGVVNAVRARYWCLRSGGALGRGCGPLVVARETRALEELAQQRIAVPGLHTTANLLLERRVGRPAERVEMVFHEIMPAVTRGAVEAGVIIHEGRFIYPDYGLVAVEDLGRWWEDETGLPIPLGGILLQRDLAGVEPLTIQRVIRRSVAYAIDHPEETVDYVRQHAQEMDDEVIQQHIALYVNDYSLDVSGEGRQAVEALIDLQGKTMADEELFPPEEA
jgi:1,4-dihydroxy-6-naphthoate synthase